MSEMLDVYATEAQARKYRDMAATEFLSSHGYKWETYQWVAPDGLTPRQLAEECQIHRGAQHEIDQIAMGAGVFDILVEGELEAAWENTKAAVRQLSEQRAKLLEALQRIADYADGVSTPVRNSVKKSAIARAAIANATQQRNATGGEG